MSESESTSQTGTEGVPSLRRRDDRIWRIGCAVLLASAAALYLPTVGYDFVGWDDETNVVHNPAVNLPGGLSLIWSTTRGPQGFPNYPLFYTSLWLEYRLWGANPAGYHAANVALHVLNCGLVLLLLRRLGFARSIAWTAAAWFAVHPLQVESVAWITERKNVLSCAFCLLAFLLYVRRRQRPGLTAYCLALIAFAAAVLSKTASVALVASFFLADAFILGGPDRTGRLALRGSFDRLLPFVAVGLVAGCFLMGSETRPSDVWPPPARPLIAAAAWWFYVSKLLIPWPLAPIYPRWSVEIGSLRWWLPLAGVVVVLAAAWLSRRRVGGRTLWSLGHFTVTLLPAIGLVPFAFHDNSFVADRFVYLACIGLFVLVAEAIRGILDRILPGPLATRVLPVVGATVSLALAVLTIRQLPTWRNSAALWTCAVQRNPVSWMAQHNLGSVLYLQGDKEGASRCWRKCIELRPSYASAYLKTAIVLAEKREFDEASRYLRRAVRMSPPEQMIGVIRELTALGRDPSTPPDVRGLAAGALAEAGGFAEAIRLTRETLTASPNCVWAHAELAWILATSPEAKWRDGAAAVSLAERALILGGENDPRLLDVLAAAYAEQGRFEQAIATATRALELVRLANRPDEAEQIQVHLRTYERRTPYRALTVNKSEPSETRLGRD